MLDDLTSESPEVRATATAEVLDARRVTLQTIAAITERFLPDEQRPATAASGIRLLGKLRAAEYVPLLVQKLTFEVFFKETKRPQPPEDLYPAVQALIDIGSPALGPLMERLKVDDDKIVQQNGAAVLTGILGPNWARAILRDEILSAEIRTVNQKLQEVLALIPATPV